MRRVRKLPYMLPPIAAMLLPYISVVGFPLLPKLLPKLLEWRGIMRRTRPCHCSCSRLTGFSNRWSAPVLSLLCRRVMKRYGADEKMSSMGSARAPGRYGRLHEMGGALSRRC